MSVRSAFALLLSLACLASLPAAAHAAPSVWKDRGGQAVQGEASKFSTKCDIANTHVGIFGPYSVCVQDKHLSRMCRHSYRVTWLSYARFVYYNHTARTYSAQSDWVYQGARGQC